MSVTDTTVNSSQDQVHATRTTEAGPPELPKGVWSHLCNVLERPGGLLLMMLVCLLFFSVLTYMTIQVATAFQFFSNLAFAFAGALTTAAQIKRGDNVSLKGENVSMTSLNMKPKEPEQNQS